MGKILKALTESEALLTLTICFAVTFVLAVVLLVLVIRLYSKYKTFMTGADGKSIEEQLAKRLADIDKLKVSSEEAKKHLKLLDENVAKTYQKCAFRKYDAFEGLGGHLSFSLCMLDSEDDGFVLSSVHTREGCYSYIKEIIKGESFVLLSDEEKNTLAEAKAGKQ
jgi:hypothetical protein